MKSYNNLLEHVRDTLLMPDIPPSAQKEAIIQILSPYFINQNVLNEQAIRLVTEAVNVARINNDPWSIKMFDQVIKEYNNAIKIDKNKCFEECAKFQRKANFSSSEYISLINLASELRDLSLDEFKYEVFRNIGALIEANIQPYLRILLFQIRMRSRKDSPMEKMTLGQIIDELILDSGYSELFSPPPRNIKLSQWRNMAQHHSTRVDNDKIIGTYGKPGKEKEVVLTRNELFDTIKRIHSILACNDSLPPIKSKFYAIVGGAIPLRPCATTLAI